MGQQVLGSQKNILLSNDNVLSGIDIKIKNKKYIMRIGKWSTKVMKMFQIEFN